MYDDRDYNITRAVVVHRRFDTPIIADIRSTHLDATSIVSSFGTHAGFYQRSKSLLSRE